jgi:hypothetical protein
MARSNKVRSQKVGKGPNPGSIAALKKGCTCPVLCNNSGRGITMHTSEELIFWYSSDCPLHGLGKGRFDREGI